MAQVRSCFTAARHERVFYATLSDSDALCLLRSFRQTRGTRKKIATDSKDTTLWQACSIYLRMPSMRGDTLHLNMSFSELVQRIIQRDMKWRTRKTRQAETKKATPKGPRRRKK